MPPVFFWRPEEEPYGNFSQWYRANLVDNTGTSFPTAEHYMMFHKVSFDSSNGEPVYRGCTCEIYKPCRRSSSTWQH